jgi:hypothetical protein
MFDKIAFFMCLPPAPYESHWRLSRFSGYNLDMGIRLSEGES